MCPQTNTDTHSTTFSFSLSKCFSQFFPPNHICQTVVNFISELQEQMCRFQKEINSKIQEKKAMESPADSSSPAICPTESTEGQDSNPGPSCDRASEVMHELEEAPDGDTRSLEEGSSNAELQHHCGGESVGTACQHVVCSMTRLFIVCDACIHAQVKQTLTQMPTKYCYRGVNHHFYQNTITLC